jgi:hypothetical protein
MKNDVLEVYVDDFYTRDQDDVASNIILVKNKNNKLFLFLKSDRVVV